MNRMLLAFLLVLASGCHTISSTAISELEVGVTVAKANVNDPTVATSDHAKQALWANGRAFADVLLDVKGTPIDPFFLTDPWALPVAAPGGGK